MIMPEENDAPIEEEAKRPPTKRTMKPTGKGKTAKHRDIGVDVAPPQNTCDDKKCPFHGKLSVRGQIIEGIVTSDKMMNTVVVKRDYMKFVPKYERYERRTGRYLAHNPPCIDAKTGDAVKIMECRPLSKTKSFVVIDKPQKKEA
jgi:small subunit ribosomal protein S17